MSTPSLPTAPPLPPDRIRRRRLWDRIGNVLLAGAALLVAAAVGGVLTVVYLTSKAQGELTTATLTISISDELLEDADCTWVRAGSTPDPTWTCTASKGDDSGNSAELTYRVVGRGEACWQARRVKTEGSLTVPLPAERLASCVTALEWAHAWDH